MQNNIFFIARATLMKCHKLENLQTETCFHTSGDEKYKFNATANVVG